MQLSTSTWCEIGQYLQTKNSLLLPVGSTEQHGPTGLIATDTICAESVARRTGEKLGILVAPTLNYGVASHHMAFAGSATLRPSIYQAMVVELLRGFYSHGFRRFYLVNGHGGNDPSIRAAFQELKHEGAEGASYSLFNWWQLPPVVALAHELFGNEEGSHATPTEVSLAFYAEGITSRAYERVPEGPPAAWPLHSSEMRKVFPTGTIRSNPGLARGDYGERILRVATDAVSEAILKAPVLT